MAQKEAISRHFTREELGKMSVDDLAELIDAAPPGAVFKAKGVVRGPDGKIKYDDPETKGSFGEEE